MNTYKLKKHNIYNAKWYHFIYVWVYNLFHKKKKSCTKQSWVQEIIWDNFEKGLNYPFINYELKDYEQFLESFDLDIEETADENIENEENAEKEN